MLRRHTRSRFLRSVALLTIAAVLCGSWSPRASAVDARVIPLWNAETGDTPDGPLTTNIGTPPVHLGSTGTSITKTTSPADVFSGHAAFAVHVDASSFSFAFTMLSLHGFGPDVSYWTSRDLSACESLAFALNNTSGAPFQLVVEGKDYRDSLDHRFVYRIPVTAAAGYKRYTVPFASMQRIGQPDIKRMRFIAFVFETGEIPVHGTVLFDDVSLREAGAVVESEKADFSTLTLILARRQFLGLWGSRSGSGLVPLNSAYVDILALNSTGGLVQVLPDAVINRWITSEEADAYILNLCNTLQQLTAAGNYLPPRYVDSVTLRPAYALEESPIDAAIVAMALKKYAGWTLSASVRAAINATLAQFDFGAFATPTGWSLAFDLVGMQFIPATYSSYSGEVFLLSLAAHLVGESRVPIETLWNSGSERIRLGEGKKSFVTAANTCCRAPFSEWMFDLFVSSADRKLDTYPDANLRVNPFQNAVAYQTDVIAQLRAGARGWQFQPDAADDGTGTHYEAYSVWLGPSDLAMPWSAALVGLADKKAALQSIQASFRTGAHNLFGLCDSVRVGSDGMPTHITARSDLWNVSLSCMALLANGKAGNRLLARQTDVRSALDRVFSRSKNTTPISPFVIPQLEGALDAADRFADQVDFTILRYDRQMQ